MKMIQDYEVEGCWTTGKTVCRSCGKTLEIVPRKGHYNSVYWHLEKEDGCVLVCCPDGCSLKLAENKMK